MLDRPAMIAATRRLRAASSELPDPRAAAEAAARMGYLWAWGVRCGGDVLDEADLDAAIRAFFIDYPDGLLPRAETD